MRIIVADCFVEVPKFEVVDSSLGHFADDAGGLAGDDAEARYDHVCRDDGAIQDAHVVLDDGKLAHHHLGPNMDVATDGGGLDDRTLSDKNVVAHSKRHVCEGPVGKNRIVVSDQFVRHGDRNRHTPCIICLGDADSIPCSGSSSDR